MIGFSDQILPAPVCLGCFVRQQEAALQILDEDFIRNVIDHSTQQGAFGILDLIGFPAGDNIPNHRHMKGAPLMGVPVRGDFYRDEGAILAPQLHLKAVRLWRRGVGPSAGQILQASAANQFFAAVLKGTLESRVDIKDDVVFADTDRIRNCFKQVAIMCFAHP